MIFFIKEQTQNLLIYHGLKKCEGPKTKLLFYMRLNAKKKFLKEQLQNPNIY